MVRTPSPETAYEAALEAFKKYEAGLELRPRGASFMAGACWALCQSSADVDALAEVNGLHMMPTSKTARMLEHLRGSMLAQSKRIAAASDAAFTPPEPEEPA